MSDKKNICILGAGGWGTALAMLLDSNGHKVTVWSHETDTCNEINTAHTNAVYLKGFTLSDSIVASTDVKPIADAEYIVSSIPSQYIHNAIKQFSLPLEGKKIINCSKGIERHSLLRVSQILEDAINLKPEDFCVLTGPSHAEEVAKQVPTTVVASSEDAVFAKEVQNIFNSQRFRVYTSDDVIGCEIGGSLKNVIALAAGVVDGLQLGDNAKAALITRGLAEMTRLGVAMGAKSVTFSGLSGLGDLVVTCNSRHSRNRMVGEMIGQGKTLKQIMEGMKMVAEGVHTTESAYDLGKKHNVEMPITEQMYEVLFNDKTAVDAISDLMNRTSKHEWWW